ncbi:MAG TPA: 4-alpha-glucanotransferase [Kofleriaceae bacterium]|nr:4-alpha-glucanotransferase [Kofleriaceae bacterium]
MTTTATSVDGPWRDALHQLAELASVDIGYWDVKGTYRDASPEGLVAILRALGVGIERPDQAPDALRAQRAALWRRPLDPCAACFGGEPAHLVLRMPAADAGQLRLTIQLDTGESIDREVSLADLPVVRSAELDGGAWVERRLDLPAGLPPGYHDVRVAARDLDAECRLLSAPPAAFAPPGALREWGLFAPVYALRTGDQLGVGDLGDLRQLARFVAGQRGAFVGTLPLLACFYDTPFQASPYSPVSRLFWNELYADLRPDSLRRLGLAALDGGAGDAVLRSELGLESALLGAEPLVDYRRAAALKRRLLERLSEVAWADEAARAQLEQFRAARPRVDDYARFRATTEAMGRAWGDWPVAQRDGAIGDGDFDEANRRYHVFAQWLLRQQLARFKDEAGTAGLYLDLPVGVDGAGYDLWRERESFASEISVGAPPDPLFWGGQNWALPPLHPVAQRRTGYRYFIDCVRAHMEHAAMLRVDHVMGLHRLFWIPPRGSAADGVYVRYPADELYAVLLIESQRQRCAVAGEDLGTVPDGVRPTMAKRGLHSLFVAQFAWAFHDGSPALQTPGAGQVASLDTHDTPPFASFVESHGLGGESGELMRRWLDDLAAGPADVVFVTLEDLWLEREAQNVPGTGDDEHPNWRRRMRFDLDQIRSDLQVSDVLRAVAERRKGPA